MLWTCCLWAWQVSTTFLAVSSSISLAVFGSTDSDLDRHSEAESGQIQLHIKPCRKLQKLLHSISWAFIMAQQIGTGGDKLHLGMQGVKNAVPKTILTLMNVEGMTRENVASHLQKYRQYLKRMAGYPANVKVSHDDLQKIQQVGLLA